jgi:hypothetical protein
MALSQFRIELEHKMALSSRSNGIQNQDSFVVARASLSSNGRAGRPRICNVERARGSQARLRKDGDGPRPMAGQSVLSTPTVLTGLYIPCIHPCGVVCIRGSMFRWSQGGVALNKDDVVQAGKKKVAGLPADCRVRTAEAVVEIARSSPH